MKIKGFKYYVIYDRNNVIINPNDFKQEVNEEATVEIYDTFGTAKGFDSLKQLENFIKNNNLTFPESEVEINPFDREWDSRYPEAKLRMYVTAIQGNNIAIDMPEFIMLLAERNIKMIVDSDYEVVWAYLEYIEDEYKQLLEQKYNAQFQFK